MPVFTASDGTKFEDRSAWRKYEFETNYTFRNRQKEMLMKLPGKIDGQPFDVSDLDECEVLLLDHCDQVQIDNLKNCRVFIGPSSESVFIRNCTNCIFTIACKQLRTRDCSQCDIFLYTLTDPIIETSQKMRFAPFNGAYHGITKHFESARLEPTNNHWSQVYDFNDPDKTGNNWCLMKPEEQGKQWVISLESHIPNAQALGPCANPVPSTAGFVQVEDKGGMQSFSITTAQSVAQQALEQTVQTLPNPVVASPTPPTSASPPLVPGNQPPAPPAPIVQMQQPPAPPVTAQPIRSKLEKDGAEFVQQVQQRIPEAIAVATEEPKHVV